MFKFLTKIFGTRSARILKSLEPYVIKVNERYEKLKGLSNDELRHETQKLKKIIQNNQKEIENKIQYLKVLSAKTQDYEKKTNLFKQIDSLEVENIKRLEEVLLEILPEAFAIVKDTARRFKENTTLEVTAQDFDKRLAQKKDFVKIYEDKAIWKNSWEAAGNVITWDMIHYDVQIIGGVILHQGKIAEMATGEGKTLVSTFPAFLNALTGKGVHIVTVNDYLAKRDCEWNGPIFQFHGLSVACIDETNPHSLDRKEAYMSDITYGTNNEFGFDYLRDNMVDEVNEIVQRRKHHFAMIDEVDSVLIDDARTPLIISGPTSKSNEKEFFILKPRVNKLFEAQKTIITKFLLEAKQKIANNNKEEGGKALFRAYRGLPKFKQLIKYLSEPGIRQLLQKTENFYLQDNSRMMPEADKPLLFTIDEKNNHIDLTDKGIEFLTTEAEGADFFILPDIGEEIAKIEHNTTLSDDQQLTLKEQLNADYNKKNERIHITTQLLKAYALFEKDVEYIVQDNSVKIVDEQTGRVLEGRRYSSGLHQAIEAKENVKIQKSSQTYATITLQNYFRMYHKLAGMTGTAETEAGEFWEIYKLDVIVAPTNKPIIRKDKDDKVYKTTKEKFKAIIDEIIDLTKNGRPVLVGTISVEISELLSKILTLRKIKHQVLNAKHHQKEAEIVANAGIPSTVTIATNMAGRGTDIKLTPESKTAGGLAIIGTERHESRRVDRQLRGRAGRQGDPGSSQFFVSLEDTLMRLFGSDRIANIMDRLGLQEGEVIQHSMVSKSIERAQKKVEENNFAHRKRLLEYDDVMNIQREVVYKRRKHALFGDRLSLDLLEMMSSTSIYLADIAQGISFSIFKLEVLKNLGTEVKITENEISQLNQDELANKIYEEIYQLYKEKKEHIKNTLEPILKELNDRYEGKLENVSIPITDGITNISINVNLKKCLDTKCEELVSLVEKNVILDLIDQKWKEHLQEMDELRHAVQNAVYEQKDPLIVYKFESFNLFQDFINDINVKTMNYLLNFYIPIPDTSNIEEAKYSKKENQKLIEKKEALYSAIQSYDTDMSSFVTKPIKSSKVLGRNEKVSVEYEDGTIKENVKYKSVEEDLKNNKCKLLD